ncbi:DUF3408 domain-containing protein [Dysgonomonas sp. ZJ709]|uniref:DUF3408 domain-containing protein n=1 Tax=Dysgonomonas sp. ZJ709 TaxID=2709797 RepID=UPI0013EE29AE|nr:DUF3408 domain-containing protein [Dysgonomonas sp. ZJ709]
MSKKIINTDDIDEKALLASIYAKKNPDRELPKAEVEEIQDRENLKTKDSVRRKRKDSDDYRTTFLNRNELKNRRCVYISSELHEVVQKIVRSIGSNDISIGGYVDTVLSQHLETNKDVINELYRRQRDKGDLIV